MSRGHGNGAMVDRRQGRIHRRAGSRRLLQTQATDPFQDRICYDSGLLVQRAPVVLPGELLLSAASALVTRGSTSLQKIWAYCLLYATIQGGDRDLAETIANEMTLRLSQNGDVFTSNAVRALYSMEVNTAYTYLLLNPVMSTTLEGTLRELMEPPILEGFERLDKLLQSSIALALNTERIENIESLRGRYEADLLLTELLTPVERQGRLAEMGVDDDPRDDEEWEEEDWGGSEPLFVDGYLGEYEEPE